jgi:Peptidase family M1 domain
MVAENALQKPAEALYLQLGQVGLDPARVYKVRGASIERSAIHISLEDGTIGFTQDVMGRITGAFFEGDGEVLITPQSAVERRSLGLFTGMAILEEHFATAYFRFNDDLAGELHPDLRAPENPQEFVARWGDAAKNLAQTDAMRLLVTFSRLLPEAGGADSSQNPNLQNLSLMGRNEDRFFRARVQGTKLGVFDLLFDTLAAEEVEAGQAKTADNGATYYDVWTSFSPVPPGAKYGNVGSTSAPGNPGPREDWIAARRFTIKTEVQPPKRIHADARVQLEVKEGGTRALLFELARSLDVESVKLDGNPVEFIHNPAVEGTQLSRRGNDILAVILPEPARSGQKLDLEFVYGGEVLAEAGSGLLYVGARGTWYPNRGMAMADFDLEFTYPDGWTLVATGNPAPVSEASAAGKANGEQISRWVSDRPLPLAGFNLGKYKMATMQNGNVTVETYATEGVEKDFPRARIQVIEPNPLNPVPRGTQVILPSRPSPAQNEATVGEAAGRAIQYYSERFGPYPYKTLKLTQMPGRDSQGWPGLVFLSSYAFLGELERQELHFESTRALMQEMIPAHETAHQWWGDLIPWSSYRDQWFSEGLANYCALMMLQEKNPAGFREIMDRYRKDLLEKNKDGVAPMDAGPVTLGVRLVSSRFPEGYEAISYGRATWLFHMLRTMLKDAAAQQSGRPALSGADEPFVRVLRRVRQRYEGRSISTRELMDAFAEDLPPALRFEGKKSLDWFVDGWVNGTSLPRLELKAVKFTPKGTGSVVTGTILQKDAPEDLVTSVPLYAAVGGKQTVLLGRVFADGEESSFRLVAPAGTHKIVLDPNGTILTSPK